MFSDEGKEEYVNCGRKGISTWQKIGYFYLAMTQAIKRLTL